MPAPAPAPTLTPVHPRPAVGTVPPPMTTPPPMDLPTPVHRPAASSFKVPTVDLPTPSRPSASAFSPPAPPPPFRGGGSTTDVPVLATPGDGGMISVGDLDLPVPADADLLTPSGPGVVDLPGHTGVDLPTPAGAGLLAPAGQELEPAHILPMPADQSIAPADQSLRPVTPRELPAGGSAGAAPAPFGLDPAAARRGGMAPREVGGGGARRPAMLAIAGIGLLAIAGGGAWAAGVFDPPEDVPVTSTGKRDPKAADGKTPPPTATALAERSPEVLGLLAKDTPESYAAAIAAAEKAGDPVGQAEAALALSLRHGHDSDAIVRANGWLQPHMSSTEPYVRRVVGLALLLAGAHADAEAALADAGARTRLYRGWLRLAQGRAADAVTEADAVLATTPDDLAAIALRHEARAVVHGSSELAAIDASLAAHPKHPGLTASAVRVAVTVGELRRARDLLASLSGSEASNGSKLLRLRLDAEIHEAAGAWARAAKLYEDAKVLASNDRSIALRRGRALLAAGRLTDAQSEVKPLVESNAEDPVAALLLIEIMLESGKGDDALAMAKAAEQKWPGRADSAVMLGRVQAMRLEAEPAAIAFASAAVRDPLDVSGAIAHARMLVRLDRLPEALGVLDTARKRVADAGAGAKAAEVLRSKAQILTDAGQSTAALAALDQALVAAPSDNRALLARGLARIDAGQGDAGRADLNAVYERTGAFVGLTAPLGRIFVREGATDRLEALVGDGLDAADADNETLLVGARLRLAQGKPTDAKAALARVLSVAPNDWEANLLLAQAQLDSDEYAEALVQIDRSMPAVPSAEKHLLRGKILEYNAKHTEARPEYLKALQIDPGLVEARFLYGRLAAIFGDSKLAADQLAKVVAGTDRFPDAFMNLGRAQRELGEQTEALASLDKALALDPKLYEAHYLRGRVLFERNEMSKASSSFETAADESVKALPWYPEALVFLGKSKAREGKNKDAIEAFEKFLSIAPADHPSRADAQSQIASLK